MSAPSPTPPMLDLDRMQSENEQLIAVSTENTPLHPIEKLTAHQNPGTLHRAITVFLFNPAGELLITQRSATKPLWPLWWDAACSTHQWWPAESTESASKRRLPFEIGIELSQIHNFTEQFHYEYHAVYDENWAENEINYILTGTTEAFPKINPAEVADFAWVSQKELEAELSEAQHRFAPWFPLAWERLQRL